MNRAKTCLMAAGTLILGGALFMPRASEAQQPPVQEPCVSRAEVAETQQRTSAFLDANTSQLRQADMDKVRGMLDRVFEPMQQAAATNCSGTNREAVRTEVRNEFEHLYSQVGVGGRMLFDNFQVPMYQGQWMGGGGIR